MRSNRRKKKRTKQQRSNRRVGIVHGIEGGLAELGYFTPQVQRVVKKWQTRQPRVLEQDIREYFWQIAPRAFQWCSYELQVRVHCFGHWPLVWELASVCEKVRNIPKTHPTHWLLRMNINMAGNVDVNGKVRKEIRALSWCEIAAEILRKGGPDFSAITLRQHAKRLRLVAPTWVQNECRRFLL